MKRFIVSLFVLFFLTACMRAEEPPDLQTPTVPAAGMATATPPTETYEQSIHFFDYDADTPVTITEESISQEEGYTVHDIHYPSPIAGQVPAYLVVPDSEGPFAGLILMHGSSGSRETLLPLAEDLVQTGAVVLTVSAPPVRSGRPWISFTPRDRDDQIQLMVDLRRGVDLLAQHPKVDPTRIGYIGYSYGAAMGGLLAGVEPRIRAYGLWWEMAAWSTTSWMRTGLQEASRPSIPKPVIYGSKPWSPSNRSITWDRPRPLHYSFKMPAMIILSRKRMLSPTRPPAASPRKWSGMSQVMACHHRHIWTWSTGWQNRSA